MLKVQIFGNIAIWRIFSPIVQFFLPAINFFFHDVVDKYHALMRTLAPLPSTTLSQTGRQGGIFVLYWYKETCTGSNSKNRVSKHEVHEPSEHDEDLPLLTQITELFQLKH